jgi:dTDP-4-amino-4,6-dideoxygalactose transaminase
MSKKIHKLQMWKLVERMERRKQSAKRYEDVLAGLRYAYSRSDADEHKRIGGSDV